MEVVAASLGATCAGPGQQAFLDRNDESVPARPACLGFGFLLRHNEIITLNDWRVGEIVPLSERNFRPNQPFAVPGMYATLSPRLHPSYLCVPDSIQAPGVEPRSLCIADGDDGEDEWTVACGSVESDPYPGLVPGGGVGPLQNRMKSKVPSSDKHKILKWNQGANPGQTDPYRIILLDLQRLKPPEKILEHLTGVIHGLFLVTFPFPQPG